MGNTGNHSCRDRSAAAAGTAAPGPADQAGCELKAGAGGRLDKVDIDRFDFVQQDFVDQIGDAPVLKNLVVIVRLIQSHAERRAASPGLHENPDGMRLLAVFQERLYHFTRFFRYFEHISSFFQ